MLAQKYGATAQWKIILQQIKLVRPTGSLTINYGTVAPTDTGFVDTYNVGDWYFLISQ